MITAQKSAAFNWVVRRWLGRTLRRRFHNIYLAGVEHLRALPRGRPVVGGVNHTNWWDGFVLYVLSDRLIPHDIHLAMEEKNLRRYKFLRRMGAFGLDLSTRAGALPGIRYAIGLLQKKADRGAARCIWIFVQGRLLPPSVPIDVRPGASFLAQQTGALLLPLVFRYEWLAESRPSILIEIGQPMEAATDSAQLAAVLNELYAQAGRALNPIDLNRYEPLFPSALSINKRWDKVRSFFRRQVAPFDDLNR